MRTKILIFSAVFALSFQIGVTPSVSAATGGNTFSDNIEDIVSCVDKEELNNIAKTDALKELETETENNVLSDLNQSTGKEKLSKYEKYEEKLFDMGLVTLDESDEDYIAIHKEMSEKSKIAAYLVDGSSVTVIDQEDSWYYIKSGKYKGYVKTENIIVDKQVETTLLDSECVLANVKKPQVRIMNKAGEALTAVGMGYQNAEYPIIGFSNDKKYVRVQRNEIISGWMPMSAIDIKIDVPTAMSKAEIDAYVLELEKKEQELLSSYLNVSVGSSGNPLIDSIVKLLAHNESGNYKSARNALSQFAGEKTITVGAWQWYGENAHNILKKICAADLSSAKKTIDGAFTGKDKVKNAKKLYADIIGNESWTATKRSFTKEELIAIKSLLGSSAGVKIQNSQVQSDVAAKVSVAKNTYKLTNNQLVVYFCDMFWQGPERTRIITKKCISHYGSAEKFCKADDALEYFHKTALNDPVMKGFSKRRNYTYSIVKKMKK